MLKRWKGRNLGPAFFEWRPTWKAAKAAWFKGNKAMSRWKNRALVVALVLWAEQTKEQIRLKRSAHKGAQDAEYGVNPGTDVLGDSCVLRREIREGL